MSKLTAAQLMVISATLRRSLEVSDPGQVFTRETRERVLESMLDILNDVSIEFVVSKPDPITLSGDSGL